MNACSGAATTIAERLLGGAVASRRPSCSFYAKPLSEILLPRSVFKINSSRISCSSGENKGKGLTYKDAGVDIDAGAELVRRIAKMTPGIGGFGGLYPLGDELPHE